MLPAFLLIQSRFAEHYNLLYVHINLILSSENEDFIWLHGIVCFGHRPQPCTSWWAACYRVKSHYFSISVQIPELILGFKPVTMLPLLPLSYEFSWLRLIYLYIAYFVKLPVSIHPVTIIEMNTKKKEKQHGSNISLLKSFCFFSTMFIHVHTCPLSLFRERTKTGGRRGGWRKEGKRGKTHY